MPQADTGLTDAGRAINIFVRQQIARVVRSLLPWGGSMAYSGEPPWIWIWPARLGAADGDRIAEREFSVAYLSFRDERTCRNFAIAAEPSATTPYAGGSLLGEFCRERQPLL